MRTPNLSPVFDYEWRNWHSTRGVGGPVEAMFTPRTHWLDGGRKKHQFEPAIHALQAIIRRAEREAKRVRAIGSGWSLNNVAFTEEYLVNTARLCEFFIGFQSSSLLESAYRSRKERMVFAQCGTQIKVLNAYLEQRRLCLPTSGASNGQTIGGAVSTGTHGSAVGLGAMQDFIRAVHLVSEGGRHYLIQRASDAVASPDFAQWLGAEHVLDDALFNAVVVSFGSFGIIHGYLFEAEPLCVLEKHVVRKDYASVIVPASTLQLSGLRLGRKEFPYHFEVVINPYRLALGQRGVFIRYMYKRVLGPREAAPAARGPAGGLQTTEDLVALAGTVSDAVPDAIPHILQSELEGMFPPTRGKPIVGTPGQTFSDTSRTNGGTSMELGVPLASVGQALGLILQICQEMPFGAPLALRYVKASPATLAFTHFEPITCTMELPGIDSARTRAAFARIQSALAESQIPHGYHWGQALPLNRQWVQRCFAQRCEDWLAVRRRFLGPRARAMFANALSARCGLAD